MKLLALYHAFREVRRAARLRKLCAKIAATIDPRDPFEREIATGIAKWSDAQDHAADRALGNTARVARLGDES